MSVLPALNAAVLGIRDNLQRFDAAASRISKNAPFGDLPRDIVELKVAKYGVQAGAAVVRAADELVGSLLDTLA